MTRRTALGIVAAILTLATVVIVPLANRAIPSEPPLSTWTTTTTTTPPATTTPATELAPITATLPPPAPPLPRQEGRFRSTAYCLTGRMASGAHTYVGAVAGNRWGIGTVITAWPNPWGDPDMEFVVEDRHAQADGDG